MEGGCPPEIWLATVGRRMRGLRVVFLSAPLVFVWAMLGVAAPAVAQASAHHRGKLARELGPEVHVSRHDETGQVAFMRSAAGQPISRPSGVTAAAPPKRAARSFLGRYGTAFGLPDAESELRAIETTAAPKGRSAVRFQQLHEGIPVIGGELVLNLDSRNRILSASGEVLPQASLDVRPRVAASDAQRTALAAVSSAHGIPADELEADPARLWVYDSRLLGGPGLDRPTLVWRFEVTAGPLQPIRELVLVDATRGQVEVHFNQAMEAKDREVCNAKNTGSQVPCTAPVRVEGGPPSGVADVNLAYRFSGGAYDFFRNRFGRDSLDDHGMTLVSTVRYCDPDYPDCPFPNAFWNGEQMVYGADHVADDVAGHELTHGVTSFNSNLFYYYQSGAINESLSDVFGELIDLTNGEGTDTAGTRWLIAEDVPSGPWRDMQDPTVHGDPDRMTSPRYEADHDEDHEGVERDNGGVHTNSGVNNKAAYLMTDGGTFNGRTVAGLGISKVARIYYEVETNLLTTASDYADLYDALQQACANLVGTAGITAGDCVEVRDAALAVEMNRDPPNAPAPEAGVCPGSGSGVNVFNDNLENPQSGRWTKSNNSGGNHWYYPQNPNPFGLDQTYATSGIRNFWGDNWHRAADYSIAMAKAVALPTRAYLRFNHAYNFDDDLFNTYDGGVVEYKAGSGPWTDARVLFVDNGYNGRISPEYDNPLADRAAFVDESNGYISSRLDLRSLAGKSVRFRFRIGTDTVGFDEGWFIDDIRIYRCASTTKPTDTTEPLAKAPIEGFSQSTQLGTNTAGNSVPVRIWWPAGSDNLTRIGNLKYRLAGRFGDQSWTNLTGWRSSRSIGFALPPASTPDDTWQFRVSVQDEAGNISNPATGPRFRADVYQENGGAIHYSSGWGARLARQSAFGGFVRPSSTANATATLSFSGSRSVAAVMPRRSDLGVAEFCLGNETDCGFRDLTELAPEPRAVVFEPIRDLSPAKTYDLRIRNVSGRIELDAIVILRRPG
jgi:Zn-dependent metalloprotease